jgi:hypothetical protein
MAGPLQARGRDDTDEPSIAMTTRHPLTALVEAVDRITTTSPLHQCGSSVHSITLARERESTNSPYTRLTLRGGVSTVNARWARGA